LVFFAFDLFGKTRFTHVLFAWTINKRYLIVKIYLSPLTIVGAAEEFFARNSCQAGHDHRILALQI
jgi:hypothetical protein